MATVFPNYTQAQFAQRIATQFPRGWANDAAKQDGTLGTGVPGNMFLLMSAISSQIQFLQTEVQYALNAQRMQTETSPKLDLASQDFFGDALPRPAGMSDANFFALIQVNLFKKVATRSALIAVIKAATGVAPRLIEPWCPADTGARDTLVSFRDIDTPANPFVNTSAFLAYNGFILSVPPTFSTLAGNPFTTQDDSAFRDANEYMLDLTGSAVQNLFSVIQAAKAFGTDVWLQFVPSLNRNTVDNFSTDFSSDFSKDFL